MTKKFINLNQEKKFTTSNFKEFQKTKKRKDSTKMAQHFLLSAKARTLSIAQIAAMSESKCCEYFRHIRWQSNNGKPVCDECGSVSCYAIKTRKLHTKCYFLF